MRSRVECPSTELHWWVLALTPFAVIKSKGSRMYKGALTSRYATQCAWGPAFPPCPRTPGVRPALFGGLPADHCRFTGLTNRSLASSAVEMDSVLLLRSPAA